MNKLEHVTLKVSSGKWLLTVAAAISFIMLVLAYVQGKPSLDPQAMAAIMTSVFTAYFHRKNGE